jgi:hypothetical protein
VRGLARANSQQVQQPRTDTRDRLVIEAAVTDPPVPSLRGDQPGDVQCDRLVIQGSQRGVDVSTRTDLDPAQGTSVKTIWIKPLLMASALMITVGLVLDIVWDRHVFIFVGATPLYSGSVGSLIAFAGLLLTLATALAGAVSYARQHR